MKRIFLIFGCVGSLLFVACKEDATSKIKAENVEIASQRDGVAKNLPVMTFEKSEHDFGKIAQGTAVETIFKFTNTGKAPLVITSASSSCGCTIPQFPKDKPIAPGESGELLVKFNGSGKNQVMKTVTVSTNTANGNEQVKIKAFVEAPTNGSPVVQ